MTARFNAKWMLVRSPYQRGWDRQRIIDLFLVLDWMMRLPDDLTKKLYDNVTELEAESEMRYVSSIEWIGIKKGRAELLIRLLERRFGPLPEDRRKRIMAAGSEEIETWSDRILDAPSPEAVLAEPSVH